VALSKSWDLTEDSFNRLLAILDVDRERAGAIYEMIHRKLVRFFEWRKCSAPQELADETINRVARKLCEGHEIGGDPGSYFFGVARFVLKEHWKQQPPSRIDPETPTAARNETHDERCQACLDQCLALLPAQARDLILRFYYFEGRAKIQNRQKLATELRVPMNALRIRVHRIRAKLEDCVESCLERNTLEMDTTSG
jgi:DNA-directed RNA polymerase specialized sigma24 family protein